MRDMVSCFSQNSINVSNPTSNSSFSCSNYSKNACISPNLVPSVQTAVTCVYKIVLCSNQTHHVTVTWSKNAAGHGGLSIEFGSDPSTSVKLHTNSRLFRKKKGSKIIESSDKSKVEAFWDLSAAKFDSGGPEPSDGFYVVVAVGSEIGLLLGDLAEDAAARKLRPNAPAARTHLVSRREHCSGNALYSTKAQFCDSGIAHDLTIRCGGAGAGDGVKTQTPALWVSIDKKTVIRVKRLQWNFRGNQTIFVDGLLVDLMWDVHDWFFNPICGSAVFMFRTRSGLDSRLWLEEKMMQQSKDQDRVDFSLLIYATRSS